MKPVFKKLGEAGFPHAQNVDVYKYDNSFDYQKYDYTQMRLTICSVPWDMGEAHIGNRTIDGVGNVVYFGSREKRDAWFDSIPDDSCYRFETKYKELHMDDTITVPIPFDVVIQYNYVFVEYSLFANDNDLVDYESEENVKKWAYFIRSVESLSPNTSRLTVMADTWQTFIYDFDITGMILERGHAPMFAMKTDEYLKDPINNNGYLLSEDVNFGDLQKVTKTQVAVFNAENMRACIVINSDAMGNWSDDNTPTAINYAGGVPNYQILSCEPENLAALLDSLDETIPQFRQTIKAVFFISSDYLELNDTFTFGGVEVATVKSNTAQINKTLLERSKKDWDYPTEYQNLAKLYTFPYSAIEVVDENGEATLIKVEDTGASLSVDVCANLVYPYINLQSVIKGFGGSESATVKFSNITDKSFNFSGRWYELTHKWEIPCFGVTLDSETQYNTEHKYDLDLMLRNAEIDRQIAKRNAVCAKNVSDRDTNMEFENAKRSYNLAKDNVYTNANNIKATGDATADTMFSTTAASASTNYDTTVRAAQYAHDNAIAQADNTYTNSNLQAATTRDVEKASANAEKTIQERGARNTTDNASAQVTANNAMLTVGNDTATTDCNLSNELSKALQAFEAGFTRNMTNKENDAAIQSAAVSAAGSVVGGAASGAISGASAGPVGAVAGAVGGLVSGGISAAVTGAQTAIATNLAQTQAEMTIELSDTKLVNTNQNNNDRTYNANEGKRDQAKATNTMITTSAANTAACQVENAGTANSTAISNADSVYDTATTVNVNDSNTAYAVADNNINSAGYNATDVFNTSASNNVQTRDTTKSNNEKNCTTAKAVADATKATSEANANATKTAHLEDNKQRYDVAIENADDIYDLAIKKIDYAKSSAKLKEPYTYGDFANGENATTKPQALFANIITQPVSAIKRAGDEFLRYGYRLDQQWVFDGDWNIGKYFTYWKLRDYWVKQNNMQDYYQDAIRFFLMGGVTVWRNPEDIGVRSIYDNFN